jgi:enamine deaminase RidA (YjgF/YER057c/UK114 family)
LQRYPPSTNFRTESENVMTRKLISSGSPYEPSIGFSRAVRVGNKVSVSGTAPIGADRKTVSPGDPAAQARRCFEIIQAALEEAGSSLDDVIRTRTFLTNIEDWEDVGKVHGEFFREVRPASTMIQVSGLIDPDWLVEIEADAVIEGEAG